MMAAGSPVVNLRRKNTRTATTAMTGMVATSRRATYWYSKPGSAPLLLHVPEHADGCLDHALHVLPHRDGLIPLPEMDVGGILRHAYLHRLGDRLQLRLVRLPRVVIAETLDLLVARPPEHRLVTSCVVQIHEPNVRVL